MQPLGVSLKQKGYVRGLPKKRTWGRVGGCVCVCMCVTFPVTSNKET